jgi:class 3 adenylate cyclase
MMAMREDQFDQIYHLLTLAETALRSGQDWETMNLYDQAIATAQKLGAVEQEALAHELAAQFWFTKNKLDFATLHLRKAHQGYVLAQLQPQADNLRQKFAPLLALTHLTLPTGKIFPEDTHHSLELKRMIDAAQAITGEIVLKKLLAKLLKVILANMDAQRAFLILDKAGQWVIEAEGSIDGEVTVFQSTPIDGDQTGPLLPISLINYVSATRQTVTLPDPAHEDRFAQDRYLMINRPKSILCAPFLHQIKLTGMLYLENNLISGIFTPAKVELLTVLASQAVIAIETAILYSVLESAMENQAVLANAYSRFVPREILQYLGKDSITQVKLGDQVQREMTVLFSDIRSFTSLSEQMTPQDNFNFINAYLGRVSPIIRKHHGFIDKYIGDAMMALFPGSTDEAVRAAIEMQREVVHYNSQRTAKGYQPLRIGIGLHRGSVMLGTVGEDKRMEGTVISDAVNLASRLEELTKSYGAAIVVSENTLFSLEQPARYNFRFLDKVKVKGKSHLVSVFEIFDGDPEALIELKLKTRTDFEKGLLHYHSQEFREAIGYFNNVLEQNPEDKAAQVYLRQATHCLWIGWEKIQFLAEK